MNKNAILNHPGLEIPNFAKSKTQQPTSNYGLRGSPGVAIVNSMVPRDLRPSPICIPNIGLVKGAPTTPSKILNPNENPWLPPKSDSSCDIKIAAITPIGTIAMVPTSDLRIPHTPRKLLYDTNRDIGIHPRTPTPKTLTPTRHLTLKIVDENTGNVKIDPILTTTIYLDCTKDKDYNYVAEHMRTIAANTMTLQKQYTTTFLPLIDVKGRVSKDTFERALSIYENNQVYYQDLMENKPENLDEIKCGLSSLEHWFAFIIEPKCSDEVDAWRERELMKLIKGVTAYCDPELYQYIQTLPSHLKIQIKLLQFGII